MKKQKRTQDFGEKIIGSHIVNILVRLFQLKLRFSWSSYRVNKSSEAPQDPVTGTMEDHRPGELDTTTDKEQ